MATANVQEITRRIQIDFIEWPMLRVTLRQACRLWNAPHDICEAALTSLVRTEFLFDKDGLFHRPVRQASFDSARGILGPDSLGRDYALPAA
jgi:hypothetical protein